MPADPGEYENFIGNRLNLYASDEHYYNWGGLKEKWIRRSGNEARNYRSALARWYGEQAAEKVQYAEAFEICEYGRQPSDDEIRQLFPFLPSQ